MKIDENNSLPLCYRQHNIYKQFKFNYVDRDKPITSYLKILDLVSRGYHSAYEHDIKNKPELQGKKIEIVMFWKGSLTSLMAEVEDNRNTDDLNNLFLLWRNLSTKSGYKVGRIFICEKDKFFETDRKKSQSNENYTIDETIKWYKDNFGDDFLTIHCDLSSKLDSQVRRLINTISSNEVNMDYVLFTGASDPMCIGFNYGEMTYMQVGIDNIMDKKLEISDKIQLLGSFSTIDQIKDNIKAKETIKEPDKKDSEAASEVNSVKFSPTTF